MDTSHAGSAHADMGGLGLFMRDDGTPRGTIDLLILLLFSSVM